MLDNDNDNSITADSAPAAESAPPAESVTASTDAAPAKKAAAKKTAKKAPAKKAAAKKTAAKATAAPADAAEAPADAAAEAPAAPAKKAPAKRASRKKAAAPVEVPTEVPAEAPVAETPAAEAPAVEAAPVKKAAAKRAPRKTTRMPAVANPQLVDTVDELPADAATAGTETAAKAAPAVLFQAPETKVAKRAPRKTTKKAAAAAPAADAAADAALPLEGDAPGTEEAAPAAKAAPVKKAAAKRAPRKTAKKAAAPVEPVEAVDEEAVAAAELAAAEAAQAADAAAEDTDAESAAEDAAADSGDADSDDTDSDDGDSDESDESDDDSADNNGDGGPRRRRRRGGRRRRKPSDAHDGDSAENGNGQDGADSDKGSEKETDKGSGQGPANGEGDDSAESEGTGSRRRRRRRRAGDDSDSSDDPEKTVTRVRKQRNPEDEITSLQGSTRLAAKKQRRQEGREAGRRRAPIVSEAEFLARRESVDRVMVIRQKDDLTQIGVLEDKVLVEHYVARESQTSLIGNVYLGRVQNVLPSMEAAFIDIGKGRNAVLYAGEVNWSALGHKDGAPRKIESVLSSGQTVLVQVTKDPIGHKGARLTSQISLPGRFLVYVPEGNTSGISRKLPDTERTRLKTLLKEIVPDHAGVIVRTAAEGASEEELTRDVERLTARWSDIESKVAAGKSPEMLYGEPDLTLKVVRDLFTEDFAKLVIEGDDAWDLVDGYVSHVAPDLRERLERFEPGENGKDIFATYRVDEQIAKGLDRKVWLPSGGSLIIDRTEAMTVVDVNTGKFTGSGGNLEETVTKNNLEAAEEMVRQLRLRDIGGIIVIDFIDMVLESNRDLVLRRLVECLGRDRTRHQVAEVTSLGLVQMTRKRIGTGLLESFGHDCDHCKGRGVVIQDHPVESGGRAEDDDSRGRRGRGGRTRGGNGNDNNDSSDRGAKGGSNNGGGNGNGGSNGNGGNDGGRDGNRESNRGGRDSNRDNNRGEGRRGSNNRSDNGSNNGPNNGGGNEPVVTPSPKDLAGTRPPEATDEELAGDSRVEQQVAETPTTVEATPVVDTAAGESTEPVVARRSSRRRGGRAAGPAEPAQPEKSQPQDGQAVVKVEAEPQASTPEPVVAQPAAAQQAVAEPEPPRVITRTRRGAARKAASPAVVEPAAVEPAAVEPAADSAGEGADEAVVLHVPVKKKGSRKR